ncbi:MAG TPA: selenium cofactor biosynthesis protein YqeC [Anaerolineales bacterium]|nr:selenium cofactor biosynthesis protein YqeC [Anaerolineales bacterium]
MYNRSMNVSLAKALRVSSSPCLAFIGAGGKTTAMFQLARELQAPVIVTATSHLGTWQTGFADRHIIAGTPAPLEELEHGLRGVILITGEIEGERTQPIHADLLNWLQQFCGYHAIPLLIEADGSRQKPLKAWEEHEPPIPSFVEQVVHVVGLHGMGKPLIDDYVHRAEFFSRLSGLDLQETITPDSLLRVLAHPEGAIKNMPFGARKAVLLNQADTPELQSLAQGLSQPLLAFHDSVIISSLKQEKIFAVHERIAGIVLAAGESTRYGQPKQLLDWKGEPFVRAVAKTALQGGLSPVLVITGADAGRVESTLHDLDVVVIRNEHWKTGQAGSIRAGIEFLVKPSSPKTGGAIFLLADQPQLTGSVLHALLEKHATQLYPVVAPMVMDRRANPVLFDRATFSGLLTLEGDVGGRAVFHNHHVEYLPWHDDRLLLDVDTPEMYQRLIADDSL